MKSGTMKNWCVGVAGVSIALVALGVLVVLVSKVICFASPGVHPQAMPPSRHFYVVDDETRSLDESARQRGREVLADRVIARLGPADTLHLVTLATSQKQDFDEMAHVVVAQELAPQQHAVPAIEGKSDLLCGSGWCDRAAAWREQFRRKVERCAREKQEWRKRLQSVKSSDQRCCSAYQKTIEYLVDVLTQAPGDEARVIVIVGDLVEESNGKPRKIADMPSNEDVEPTLQGVQVHLVQTSGQGESATTAAFRDYWSAYFRARGAEVALSGLNNYGGLQPAPLAGTECLVTPRDTEGVNREDLLSLHLQ